MSARAICENTGSFRFDAIIFDQSYQHFRACAECKRFHPKVDSIWDTERLVLALSGVRTLLVYCPETCYQCQGITEKDLWDKLPDKYKRHPFSGMMMYQVMRLPHGDHLLRGQAWKG